MSFGQAIQTVFQKYAEFSGRARRPEFWWWVLFVFLVNLALNALWVPVGRNTTIGSWLSWIWSLAILLPTLAVLVRRLRDAGYAWGHVFWLLLPFFGAIILIVFAAQPSKDAVPGSPGTPAMQAGAPVAAPETPHTPEPEEPPPPGSA